MAPRDFLITLEYFLRLSFRNPKVSEFTRQLNELFGGVEVPASSPCGPGMEEVPSPCLFPMDVKAERRR